MLRSFVRLIIETNERLLIETTFDDNIKFFLDEIRDAIHDSIHVYGTENISQLYHLSDSDDWALDSSKLDIDVLRRIPALSKYKIVKFLGAGKDGVAVLLSNDNVLKLGKSDGIEYKTDKIFKGAGSANDVIVYDQGIANANGISLRWMEMQRLMSIIEFGMMTSNSDYAETYDAISVIFFALSDPSSTPVEEFGRAVTFLKWNGNILKALKKAMHGWDSKPENTGVIRSSVISGKPIFVEFD